MKWLTLAILLTNWPSAINHYPSAIDRQRNIHDSTCQIITDGKWLMVDSAVGQSAELPLIFWQGGIETAPALKQAGIEHIAVAADKTDEWRRAGFTVTPISEAELSGRQKLAVPGAVGRPGLAAATGRPWVDANGWQFTRNPSGKFFYELPKGRAALALAEAFAYNADALLKIDPADLVEVGRMFAFLKNLPAEKDLPLIADIGVIDDGSDLVGEVMNLLSRRNLLFKPIAAASTKYRVNIKLGTAKYPKADAADPNEFAQTIRRKITDDKRTLRIYGTEVVIARLTGDGKRTRLHLLNYGRRDFAGMRVRLLGKYDKGETLIYGIGHTTLEDFAVIGNTTEFSLARMSTYAVIELPAAK